MLGLARQMALACGTSAAQALHAGASEAVGWLNAQATPSAARRNDPRRPQRDAWEAARRQTQRCRQRRDSCTLRAAAHGVAASLCAALILSKPLWFFPGLLGLGLGGYGLLCALAELLRAQHALVGAVAVQTARLRAYVAAGQAAAAAPLVDRFEARPRAAKPTFGQAPALCVALPLHAQMCAAKGKDGL